MLFLPGNGPVIFAGFRLSASHLVLEGSANIAVSMVVRAKVLKLELISSAWLCQQPKPATAERTGFCAARGPSGKLCRPTPLPSKATAPMISRLKNRSLGSRQKVPRPGAGIGRGAAPSVLKSTARPRA
jgi:hypothetical protein